jgi:hypothetical protein
MTSLLKKAAVGAALTASALMVTAPAHARDRYYRHGNDGAAIAAGVIGLAAIAALASSDRHRYYYDDYYYYPRRAYYPRTRIYYRSYPRYYGYNSYRWRSPYRDRYYYRGW